MQSFLSLEILFLTMITPTLLCITFGCNFTDIINVSLRLGHDFSTMICSAPIGFYRAGWTHPMFFKLVPNEKCVKGMQVRKQGWG